MTFVLVRLRTARALGFGNVANVLSYRVQLRAGVHAVQRLAQPASPVGPFFGAPRQRRMLTAPTAWDESACYFGWFRPPLTEDPPVWHRNPFTGRDAARSSAPWWTIPDFDPETGDVKVIWEASRMDWVVNMAQRAVAGSAGEVTRLNQWLADWCNHNPPYRGHNWKCAQEASIRILHLALASLILGATERIEPSLRDLLAVHLERIAPTVGYARAQNNNHGTSEAAGLFIGGSWLQRAGVRHGASWAATGRALLEDCVARLIEADGTFSQYSVVYHRLMLDTLSLVETWRRHLSLPEFSRTLRARAAAATEWLRGLVDPISGEAPNLGANDGANLLPLTDGDGRDFRPAVQLASALFLDERVYAGVGSWDMHAAWLGVDAHARAAAAHVDQLDRGGFAVFRRGSAMALLRYPRFKFRPSHADILHLDLWVKGENIFRDAGSFSYAAPLDDQDAFVGIRGHCAAQFDGHDQMPRLGRFLWGAWPATTARQPIIADDCAVRTSAAYRDAWGATHDRAVRLADDRLEVVDNVGGFTRSAVLRWRLRPGPWSITRSSVSDGAIRLTVTADVPIIRTELVTGWESRHYLRREEVPVLEVEIARPGTLRTICEWSS